MHIDENGGLKTHHCSDCNQSYNASNPIPNGESQSSSENGSLFRTTVNDNQDSSYDEESFLRERKALFDRIDEYLDGERDEELYAKALKEADGDETEADHIYYGLFMRLDNEDD